MTTHLVPSAYPRYSHFVSSKLSSLHPQILNDPPHDLAPKNERRQWAEDRREAIIRKREAFVEMREEDVKNERDSFDLRALEGEKYKGPVLWNAVNRYARVKDPKDPRDFGLTVVVCHANGLHKEVRYLSLLIHVSL